MNELGITLLWCIAQVTLLSLAACAAYALLRRFGPKAGALVIMTSMGLIVGLSLMMFSPWPSWTRKADSREVAEVEMPTAEPDSPALPRPNSDQSHDVTTDTLIVETPPESSVDQSSAMLFPQAVGEERSRPRPAVEAASPRRWPLVLVGLMSAGLLMGLTRLVGGLVVVGRYRRQSEIINDPRLTEMAGMFVAELGCRRRLELRESNALVSAATVGWRHPLILLPRQWRQWSDEQLRAVLAHELAHIVANDFLTGLLGQIGLTLHFYHPVVHWLIARLRLEQELAADGIAATLSGGRRIYLTTIATMALEQEDHNVRWPARALLPAKSTFLRRIAMLRDKHFRIAPVSVGVRATSVAVMLLLGLAVAGLRPSPGGRAIAQEPEKEVTDIKAEGWHLELGKTDSLQPVGEHFLYQAVRGKQFSTVIHGHNPYAMPSRLPSFDSVIEKDREEYNTEVPVRGVFELGTQLYGYVLDSSVASAAELDEQAANENRPNSSAVGEPSQRKGTPVVPYDRLYIDLNHNGDLTDEEVITAGSTRKYDNSTGNRDYITRFVCIDVPLEVESTTLDYAISFQVAARCQPRYSFVHGDHEAAAYREGEITLDGKKRGVLLLDYDSNGRFGDGDRLYIDPDAKKAARNPFSLEVRDGVFTVQSMLSFEGRFYRMSVSPSGDTLTLDPWDLPVGYVSNLNANYRAALSGEQGIVKIQSDASGKAMLPVGEWTLKKYAIDRTEAKKPEPKAPISLAGMLGQSLGPKTEEQGPRHTVIEAATTRLAEPFEVVEGETTPLAFGPPYRPVFFTKEPSGRGWVTLGFALVGRSGEVCTKLLINGKEPRNPKFTITTLDDHIVHEGEFEFASGYATRYKWEFPEELDDEYLVWVRMNGGPFEIDKTFTSILRKRDLTNPGSTYGNAEELIRALGLGP